MIFSHAYIYGVTLKGSILRVEFESLKILYELYSEHQLPSTFKLLKFSLKQVCHSVTLGFLYLEHFANTYRTLS